MEYVCNRVKVCGSSSSKGYYSGTDNCHTCFEDEFHILRRHFWGALFLFTESIFIFFSVAFTNSCVELRLFFQFIMVTNLIMAMLALFIDHHVRKNWPIVLLFAINIALRGIAIPVFATYDYSTCVITGTYGKIYNMIYILTIEAMIVFSIVVVVGSIRSVFYCVKCAFGKIASQKKELDKERARIKKQNDQIQQLENKLQEMKEDHEAVPIAQPSIATSSVETSDPAKKEEEP